MHPHLKAFLIGVTTLIAAIAALSLVEGYNLGSSFGAIPCSDCPSPDAGPVPPAQE